MGKEIQYYKIINYRTGRGYLHRPFFITRKEINMKKIDQIRQESKK